MRGVHRDAKKGNAVAAAEQEIARLDPLIERGLRYLESELARATEEEGHSVEAIRILRFLAEQRTSAWRAASEPAEAHRVPPEIAANYRRYDLSGEVDYDQ